MGWEREGERGYPCHFFSAKALETQVHLQEVPCEGLGETQQNGEADRSVFLWFVQHLPFSLNYVEKHHLKVKMPICQCFLSLIIEYDAATSPHLFIPNSYFLARLCELSCLALACCHAILCPARLGNSATKR